MYVVKIFPELKLKFKRFMDVVYPNSSPEYVISNPDETTF
jgi:hypothetical protein